MLNKISNVFSTYTTYSGKIAHEHTQSFERLANLQNNPHPNSMENDKERIISACRRLGEKIVKLYSQIDASSEGGAESLKILEHYQRSMGQHMAYLEKGFFKEFQDCKFKFESETAGVQIKLDKKKSLGFFNKLRLNTQIKKYDALSQKFEKSYKHLDDLIKVYSYYEDIYPNHFILHEEQNGALQEQQST